ncbi:MAG: glutamate 5-kinase [Candidatus Diapherotrites archaeon]|uniref:Glutamate 5-kinase n=1 Tax=Candidatus Iainarchaeum sp. TaxID=3101447 RepID=A0A938YV14_9ARCH|nr:glutamate 5-kinase [Candidatus Diapherotrites archaeon]
MGRESLGSAKRIVVKIGTNALTNEQGLVDQIFVSGIAGQVMQLKKQGKEVIIVSSGAIGSGFREIGLEKPPRDVAMRQASFAVGQNRLMFSYAKAFGKFSQKIAQILLTYDAFSRRQTYLNLRNAFNLLLELDVIPIVNENDVVSINEIDRSFGDNDKLSALVASKLDAQLLVILSDIGGLYTANPRRDKKAERIPIVAEITREIEKTAGGRGSETSVGGMKSKIEAAKIAAASGCAVVIADGRAENVLQKILAGEDIGTLFLPKKALASKAKWVFFSQPKGRIEVDKGAMDALLKRKSLLSNGITAVKGDFREKEVVELSCNGHVFARGLVDFDSKKLQKKKEGTAIKTENLYIIEK